MGIMDVYAVTKSEAMSSTAVWSDYADLSVRLYKQAMGTRIRLRRTLALYLQNVGVQAVHSDDLIFIGDLLAAVPGLSEKQGNEELYEAVEWWGRMSNSDVDLMEVFREISQFRKETV